MQIYSNWVISKERRVVKKHYLKVYEIYSDLTGELKHVYAHAKGIIEKLKIKKISNCKELAKRILRFEVVELEEKIEENIKKMEEFLYHSY